ncbi:Spy/CpxP family protein refolding chaperone [Undibacterium sp. LX40W]|uniref:Spy/CpxP family protein refolding chaperone n=1 Tax=Undibacterium nitidum TaxID=2762298 RepID=A0A923HQL1_9BURK|nr:MULTISPECIES: Spy/CpxP family protein refolding chaperone [Undibacterium]MBC3883377.1 Spy/CpxP family protein refolding chaperone [Undibacterium nitidum]MBC3893659.1 Spy/CpxP family protein refolding chaperone [Undibacterium sp. LX40W]
MKTIKSSLVLALLAMGVAVSSVYAQAPAKAAGPDQAQRADKMQKRMQERMEKHHAMMHDKLKITPEQEGAWKTFTEAGAQGMPRMMSERLDHQAMSSLSAPAMMEKQMEHSKARMVIMQKHLDAMKAFYTVLSPEQQKTFDDMHKRMHRRAKMMRHGGMMERDGHGGHDMDHNMPKK